MPMPLPQIKFSHHYAKLRAAEPEMEATLILVQDVRLEDLSQEFLKYDTDDGLYELPKKGEYMMLVFEGSHGLLTTLRSAFPAYKQSYYRGLIGKRFKIVITPPEDAQ